MKSMRKWMLGAALVGGVMGLGTTTAHAAQFGIYVSGGPVAYVPPCPGPGYSWVAGYYSGGYWVPGRWNYIGVRRDWDGPRYWDHDNGWHRGWDHDHDRGWDHDRDRGWDRDGDHFRGRR